LASERSYSVYLMSLTKQPAIEMLESDDLVGIGMEAHQMRLAKNDPRVVTYQIIHL